MAAVAVQAGVARGSEVEAAAASLAVAAVVTAAARAAPAWSDSRAAHARRWCSPLWAGVGELEATPSIPQNAWVNDPAVHQPLEEAEAVPEASVDDAATAERG
eukprot:6000226-Prymnesium_polylepis.1